MDDVTVVGAGPAGLRCATLLEENGVDLAVLDSKKALGEPVQCSGLISRNLDRFLKVPDDCIEHEVSGAVVRGPGGRELRLEKKGGAAYVIDRRAFDRFLAGQVSSEIRLGTMVRGLRLSGQGASLRTNRGDFRSQAVLGCDGPSSVVRRHFGHEPGEMLQGIIAITSKPDNSGYVEMHLDRELCDGFAWKIPRGRSTEYGMLGSSVSFDRLLPFFSLGDVKEKRAGPVPVGPCRTYFERTLLVGDSAGQTKPWSGGGVVYGLTCAGHASGVMKKALDRGDLSEGFLSEYERAWKEELDRPICLGMMGRELFRDMDNKRLGEFLDRLKSMDLNSLDMDFPSLGFL